MSLVVVVTKLVCHKVTSMTYPSNGSPPHLLCKIVSTQAVLKSQIELVICESLTLLGPAWAGIWLVVPRPTFPPNINLPTNNNLLTIIATTHLKMFHKLVQILKPPTRTPTVWLQGCYEERLLWINIIKPFTPASMSLHNPSIRHRNITGGLEGHRPVEKSCNNIVILSHNNHSHHPIIWYY